MKTYERHEINPSNVVKFMIEHKDEAIIFREMHTNKVCLDIAHELSKAEFNELVLDNMLRHIDDILTEEEKAAIEYAIECIKTLDDMGIIKENKDDD